MALPRNGPRRLTRPRDASAGVQPSVRPGAGRVAIHDDVPDIVQPVRRDAAREELLRVLDVRGRAIDRKRGMRPSPEFRRAAEAYILRHHYGYCVRFARSKSARHVPMEDMLQACLLGAYTALERFQADHEHTYRFLSYAQWYLLMECNNLLHRDESLVVVPDWLKKVRADVARACRDDVSDEEAAELLRVDVADVRAARDAHLGHDHRRVDERSRACRSGLDDARAAHDARAEALRQHAGLAAGLAALDPLLRQVLHDEYGVGEHDPTAPRPSTPESRRALRHVALRRLREEME